MGHHRRANRADSALTVVVTVLVGALMGGFGAGCAPADQRPALVTTVVDDIAGGADGGSGDAGASASSTTVATLATQPPGPDTMALPGDAIELATALLEAESEVRNTDLATSRRAAWGRRQQALYAVLSAHPDWADDTLAAVADRGDGSDRHRMLVEAITFNWSARQHLDQLVAGGGVADELPAWRIRKPVEVDKLLGYYDEAEAATGVPWSYLAAINTIETRVGRISGTSTAGAVGPMQFLPSTWADCCEGDPNDDRDAIIGAATYLVDRGAPGNMDAAIFGYNRSEHYVAAVKAYASVLAADRNAFAGYHAWEIYFRTTEGIVVIPVGYDQPEPVPVTAWLRLHPDTLFDPTG